ncbi:MAG: LemA family protein [Solirubrobacterales bacterium]
MVVLIVVIVLVALIVLYGVVTFNRLISLRNRAEEGFSDIDVQLKRRHDLIPNLVETVKGYAAHERTVFENVTAARSNAVAAHGPEAQGQAENVLTGALRQLFAVAENYPDLKASQNFLELQNELTDTEDKIQAARRFYNMTVRDLNIKIQQFPSSVIAGMKKITEREFFEVEDPTDREVPAVSFAGGGGAAAPPGGAAPPAG